MSAIGLLGGTFDPVHFGHLRPAVELLQDLAFAELRLIPCNIPPHRPPTKATAQQRLAMLQAAIAGVPKFTIDDHELRRPGPSYMVDTLTSLRRELPATPLCLIMGMDAFNGLPSWHRWEELIALAHIVVMRRPGGIVPTEGVLAKLLKKCQIQQPELLHQKLAGQVLLWPVTQLDISATQIRKLIAQGKSTRYLLPDVVRELIEVERLYR